jgi:hypothetical protein
MTFLASAAHCSECGYLVRYPHVCPAKTTNKAEAERKRAGKPK